MFPSPLPVVLDCTGGVEGAKLRQLVMDEALDMGVDVIIDQGNVKQPVNQTLTAVGTRHMIWVLSIDTFSDNDDCSLIHQSINSPVRK